MWFIVFVKEKKKQKKKNSVQARQVYKKTPLEQKFRKVTRKIKTLFEFEAQGSKMKSYLTLHQAKPNVLDIMSCYWLFRVSAPFQKLCVHKEQQWPNVPEIICPVEYTCWHDSAGEVDAWPSANNRDKETSQFIPKKTHLESYPLYNSVVNCL